MLWSLKELTYYLSSEYLRLHEASEMLIFRNQSWEEGCKLRDELRPDTLQIRKELKRILDALYIEIGLIKIDTTSPLAIG